MSGWTDAIDLENETIALGDGAVASFDDWWDQLVGMAARYQLLRDERSAAGEISNKNQRQYEPSMPPYFTNGAEFFAWQKQRAVMREAYAAAQRDIIRIDREINELVERVRGMALLEGAAVRITLNGDSFLFGLRVDGYGSLALSLRPYTPDNPDTPSL